MSLLSTLNHRHLLSCVSTNTQLIEELKAARLDPTLRHLLTAETQSAGRGQRERRWQSPKGNVYLSLYLPMTVSMTGLLSLIVGYQLAMMPVIKTINKARSKQGLPIIGVKWANDLGFYQSDSPAQLCNNLANENISQNENVPPNENNPNHTPTSLKDAHRPSQIMPFNKLAGILIEPVWHAGQLLGAVIGVGLNVAAAPLLTPHHQEGMSYQAIGLSDLYPPASHQEMDAAINNMPQLYEQISQALIAAYDCFEQISTSPTRQAVDEFLQLFSQVDALAGQRMQVTRQIQTSTEILTGNASGIDRQGCLQLRLDDASLIPIYTGRIDVLSAD